MFIKYEGEDGRTLHHGNPPDVPIGEADAVMFLCPKCFNANRGPVRTHSVICNRPRVPLRPGVYVGPGRWEFAGTGIADLTLNGASPGGARSIQLLGAGCQWHGFINNGEATLQ